MSKVKSPSEKKRLSLALDRRNAYRENAKASRKGIPLSKARSHRAERHSVAETLREATLTHADEAEASARSTARQKKAGAFKKSPDESLAAHIKQLATRRKR
jgi:hypothetical protein